jgi:hypothetical protein
MGNGMRSYLLRDHRLVPVPSFLASAVAMSVLLVLCAFALALVCGVASASASELAPETFGGFSSPGAMAVDEATGDLFILDVGTQTIDKVDAAGAPVPFATSSYVSGNELTGTPTEPFSLGTPGEAQVAVDNSHGANAGDVYVTDSGHKKVDVYSSEGVFLGEVNLASHPEPREEACGVAVGTTGTVYVAYFSGYIARFTPTDTAPEHDTFTGQLTEVGSPCYIAVDSAGDVYVQQWSSSGTGELRKYAASQFEVEGKSAFSLFEEGASAAAEDLADGDVFVDRQSQVREFDSTAHQVGTPFASALVDSRGIAFNASTGTLYLSDAAFGTVSVYAPGAPVIASESVSNVASTSAELHVEASPHFTASSVFFQYGTDQSYSSGTTPIGAPLSIGHGVQEQPASVSLSGLTPDTTYHFRAVAHNDTGGPGGTTVLGADQTFTTSPTGTPGLPDGRAWEMVSPLEKNGGQVAGIDGIGLGGIVQASPDGTHITYASLASFSDGSGAPLGSQYLSDRTSAGWTTENITTATAAHAYCNVGCGTPYEAFSTDLSTALLFGGLNPPLSPDAPAGGTDFYLRENQTGVLTSLLTSADPQGALEETPDAATPDLAHIVVASVSALTPGATAGIFNLYEWGDGHLQPVNVLPGVTDGATEPGAAIPGPEGQRAISSDGSRVVWEDVPHNALYVREGIGTPQAKTVQADLTHGAGRSGDGEFMLASGNGGAVLFTDERSLTTDSTAVEGGGERCNESESGGKCDLYEYNVDSEELSDLTTENPTGAGVQGALGASEDASTVYFVADGVLTRTANADGALPVAGENNLYVQRRGLPVAFIGTLTHGEGEGTDSSDWSAADGLRTARVSTNGTNAVFMSHARLTAFDNRGFQEVYLFDAATSVLTCLSCNLSGAVPTGPASIPGGTSGTGFNGARALYDSRVLADEGRRVFFNSFDGLVPGDVNGREDVYEWEAEGTGSCTRPSGCVFLLSGGTAPVDSRFVDASEGGDDVFFVTGQQLVKGDTDELVDLYDARVGGGFHEVSAPACTGAGCQGVPAAPPSVVTPSSATFSGIGNFLPVPTKPALKRKTVKCAKGKIKKNNKCVKTKKKPKKTKKASRNRRAR